jgi:hypothetical protein
MRAKVVVYLPCRDQGGCLKSRVDERCGGRVPGVFFSAKRRFRRRSSLRSGGAYEYSEEGKTSRGGCGGREHVSTRKDNDMSGEEGGGGYRDERASTHADAIVTQTTAEEYINLTSV